MVWRVEAYLRIACSVLGFETGELWCARNIPGQSPSLRFIQLFTSPTYEEFHRTHVNPEANSSGPSLSAGCHSRHRFSPIVCRGVCDGGQIVWANTRISNGFIGCTDLPLNTAVGLPVCSIGADLCIIVLYSVPVMPISPNAVEFLCSITRTASEGKGGFLPNVTASPISPPMTEQFVGVWDMAVFVSKYANDVDFQLFPLNQLQGYIDFEERVAFKELFEGFKQKRDGRFTAKQIDSLRHREHDDVSSVASSENNEDYGDSGAGAFMIELDNASDDGLSVICSCGEDSSPHLTSKPVSDWYSTLKSGDEITRNSNISMTNISTFSTIHRSESFSQPPMPGALNVDARISYKKHRERFHEFMVAVLGLTIFDAAELWMLSDRSNDLNVVAALHRDGDMQVWTMQSRDIRLQKGQDVPGQVLLADYPLWDHNYDKHQDEAKNYPRAHSARSLGVRTAFGAPLAGPSGAVGVLMLYSRKEVDTEPLVVSLVLKAVRLLSASALGLDPLTRIDIENIIHAPVGTVFESEAVQARERETYYQGYEPKSPTIPLVNSSINRVENIVPTTSDFRETEVDTFSNIAYDRARVSVSNAEFGSGLTLLTLEGGSEDRLAGCPTGYNDIKESSRKRQKVPIALHWEETHRRLPGSMSSMQQLAQNEEYALQTWVDSTDNFRRFEAANTAALPHEDMYLGASSIRPVVPGSWTSHIQAAIGQRQQSKPHAPTTAPAPATAPQDVFAQAQLLPPALGCTSSYQNYWTSSISHPAPVSMPVQPPLCIPTMQINMNTNMTITSTGLIPDTRWHMPPQSHAPEVMSQYPNISSLNQFSYLTTPMINKFQQETYGMGTGGHERPSFEFDRNYGGEYNLYPYAMPPRTTTEYSTSNTMLPTTIHLSNNSLKSFASGSAKDSHKKTNISKGKEQTDSDKERHCLEVSNSDKICKLDGCTAMASKRSPYCIEHIGTRRCQFEGCVKCAQGNTKFCIAHGGGRRCTFPGCSKGARDKFFCAAHGGGKRCKVRDCTKSAVGGSKLCTAHGGGKRCQAPGCIKSAQSSTFYCVRHGGGRKCRVSGCSKVSRGKTEFCAAHGGGIKCRADNCPKAAAGKYFYCKEHLRQMNIVVENLDDMEDDEEFSGVSVDPSLVSNKRALSDEEDYDDEECEDSASEVTSGT